MDFIQHPLCDDVLGAPKGVSIEECRALPILRFVENGQPQIASFWKPDAEELAFLNAGRAVVLIVWGHTHAPVFVGVASS